MPAWYIPLVIAFFLPSSPLLESMAYTPKGKGAGVVKDVVDTINGLGIFPNDHKFLCRVAWVESKYGEDPNTYRSGYYGGIWQVSELFQINYDKKQQRQKRFEFSLVISRSNFLFKPIWLVCKQFFLVVIAPYKGIQILESGKYLLVIQNPGIFCLWNAEFLGFEIRNTAQEILSPINDWNPESTDKDWNSVRGIQVQDCLGSQLHGAIINYWRQYLMV